MKKFIIKHLKYQGKKLIQLEKELKYNNFITRELLLNAVVDMKISGELLECYGGYLMLNK